MPLLLPLAALPLAAETRPKGYEVQRYRLALAPDFTAKAFAGRERVELRALKPLTELRLEAHDLRIRGLSLDGRATRFEIQDGQLVVPCAETLRPGSRHVLRFAYTVVPTQGVHWEAREVHTAWATSHWMACDEDPSDRARFSLELTLPQELRAAGSGRLAGSRRRDGRCITRWESAPVPSFVMGFAAGAFTELQAQAGGTRLRFLSAHHDAAQLASIFGATAAMTAFFEAKAGAPLPGGAYTQVLAAGNPEQELATFTLMGTDYGDDVLKDPSDLWLMAHELAHQWWGIGVACRDWTDFWLNEGIATFMADAYLERAFGPGRYKLEMDLVEQHYQKAKAAGRDHPLHYLGWTSVSQVGGSLPYNKGARVLKLLRERLGEDRFWAGLRRYTQAHLGGTVVSEDLQRAMEAASGEDLRPFFDEWVNH